MAFNRKAGAVYLMTTASNTALYTGVTAGLRARVWQHRTGYHAGGFTARYHCTKLVYYRWFEGIEEAIAEEKRIKGGSRAAKEALVNAMNPQWADLWEHIQDL